MIVRLFDKPPAAAVSWAKHFFAEAWSRSEIDSFVTFCEQEYQNAADMVAKRGEPYGSFEYIKIDQILYHIRNQAWLRVQQLSKIDSIHSSVRERLGQLK